MVKIALQGIYGRMGQTLVEMIDAHAGCEVVAGVDSAQGGPALPCPVVQTAEGLAALQNAPQVVIDFSLPQATRALLEYCGKAKLPCVICTTGLGEDIHRLMEETARQTAVFFSANMSLGINLLARLAKQAQAALTGFDIEIIEKHHHNKLDAPSGTALLLADGINQQAGGRYNYVYDRHDVRQKRGENELGIHSVRGGSIVGEHEVLFCGPDEVVSLGHVAYSRRVFASGAVAAALFLAYKATGLYGMDDLMETL